MIVSWYFTPLFTGFDYSKWQSKSNIDSLTTIIWRHYNEIVTLSCSEKVFNFTIRIFVFDVID